MVFELFFHEISESLGKKAKSLTNAPTLAVEGVDTAEDEPLKVWGYGLSTPLPPWGHGSTGAISTTQVLRGPAEDRIG